MTDPLLYHNSIELQMRGFCFVWLSGDDAGHGQTWIVMLCCAVARPPRFDTSRNQQFDSKLGIWPFIYWESAQRSSRNRPAGTLVMKCLSVKNEVIESTLAATVVVLLQESRGITDNPNLIPRKRVPYSFKYLFFSTGSLSCRTFLVPLRSFFLVIFGTPNVLHMY